MNPTAGPDGLMMAHPSPGVDSISGRAFSARRSSSVAQARASARGLRVRGRHARVLAAGDEPRGHLEALERRLEILVTHGCLLCGYRPGLSRISSYGYENAWPGMRPSADCSSRGPWPLRKSKAGDQQGQLCCLP